MTWPSNKFKEFILIIRRCSSFLSFVASIDIELLKSFSNLISERLVPKAVHGRFDWQDVKHNLLGLYVGSVCYFLFLGKRVGKAGGS
jgi:hypothetical protein